MKIAIVVSLKDPAGLNIKERLIEGYDFKTAEQCLEFSKDIRLYTVAEESVYNEDIDKKIDADLFIFATKHESKSKIPSLCVHSPGNWGLAQLGGKDFSLCIAPADHIRVALFKMMKKAKGTDYQVIQECTHHGPYLEKPCIFIEIGSSIERWKDPAAAEIIAQTIMEIAQEQIPKHKIAIGIGGLHHTPQFTSLMEKRPDIAFGHICPKYNLENLDKEMLKQAIEKSYPGNNLIFVQWKGISGYKQKVAAILEGMEFEKI